MAESHNTESAPALKPCPFCGGPAVVQPINRRGSYHAHCTLCGGSTAVEYSKADAIAAWNLRSGDRDATIEECAKVAESAVSAGERVRDEMAPKAPISGLEDALHSIVIMTARGIAATIRALRRAGETTRG